MRRLAWMLGFVFCIGCADSPTETAEPTSTQPSSFTDITTQAGLDGARSPARPMDHILESTGTGVAVGDYDGDGLEDLYFSAQPTIAQHLAGEAGPPNRLMRNNGDGTFSDVAAATGVDLRAWSNAAYFVDYDNDGDQDLFVLCWGRDYLYRNKGDGSFEEIGEQAGVAGTEQDWSSAAAFGDLDQDGDVEIWITQYATYDPADPPHAGIAPNWRGLDVFLGPKGLPGQRDRLLSNNGDGSFRDISREAGLFDQPGLYGLGVVMHDFDRDGDIDVYVANDSVVNQLWRNDGRLPLVEIGTLSGTATNENAVEQAGMGVEVADFDDNGFPDLYVTNFSHDWNTLYWNDGDLNFRDGTFEAQLSDSFSAMGWGAKAIDFDLDGRLDLAVANGHIYPQVDEQPQLGSRMRQPNALSRQTESGRFERVNDASWSAEENSRGLATFDVDRDGDLDLIWTHLDAAPTLLRNDAAPDRQRIAFLLEGTRSNRDALGAVIELTAGGRTQTRLVQPFGSFLSQSSRGVYFGVGDAAFADRVVVRWPSGESAEWTDLESGRMYAVREGDGIVDRTAFAEPQR